MKRPGHSNQKLVESEYQFQLRVEGAL